MMESDSRPESINEKCQAIELDSAFFRESAHRFYNNMGFEKRGYVFSKLLLGE